MSRLRRRSHISLIEVFRRTRLVREVFLYARRLKEREASEMAREYLNRELRRGRVACLHPLYGSYVDGEIEYTPSNRDPATIRHERFHALMDGFRHEEMTSVMEESAAFAWETTTKIGTPDSSRINADIRRYRRISIAAVGFAHALSLSRPNGLLTGSISTIVANDRAGIGEDMAIAISNTREFLLYVECLEIIRRYSPKQALRILSDAISLSYKRGLTDAREFLLSYLTGTQIDRIQRMYDVPLRDQDLRRFRTDHKVKEEHVFLD